MKQEPLDTSRNPLDALKQAPHTRKSFKRLRDAGALYKRHLNTDLVQFKQAEDGTELWTWANQNQDPYPGKRGQPWHVAITPAEGQLVLVYDPTCVACQVETQGCHYCHRPYDSSACPICGRGQFMTDQHGWPDRKPVRRYYVNPEDVGIDEVDLNEVPYGDLAELDPMLEAVADALTTWYCDRHTGEPDYEHRVATFLDTLASNGYGVVKIEESTLADTLPAPEGNQ